MSFDAIDMEAGTWHLEEGQYGSKVLVRRGRCKATTTARTAVEGGTTKHYELVLVPQTQTLVLKSMDGTTPTVLTLKPSTFPTGNYNVVKVGGILRPLAATQPTGGYGAGSAILEYEMRYQEVGALS